MSFPAIHRVVTGHDAAGRAIVSSNGPLPIGAGRSQGQSGLRADG